MQGNLNFKSLEVLHGAPPFLYHEEMIASSVHSLRQRLWIS